MTQAEIGAGDIVLDLDGHKLTLRPSLQAAIALSSGRGGITGMVQRCLDFEFDAIHTVILAGLGQKGSKDLRELIFKAGLITLGPHCIRFLHIVANGGRPVSDEEEDEEDAPLG